MGYIKDTMIVVESDRNIFESVNILQRFRHTLWIKILSILPVRTVKKIFEKSSRDAQYVKHNATTHRALEVLYNFDYKIHLGNGLFDAIFTYIWHHLYSVRATRNRLKMVKKYLRECINEKIKIKGTINVISLGCGSSRAVLEVIDEFDEPMVSFNFLALDISQEALDYTELIVQKMNKKINLILVKDKVTNLQEVLNKNNFLPDIIEMVGLLDYFNNDKATRLLNIIYSSVTNYSTLITCNIRHNIEENFLTSIVDWPMDYKNESQMFTLLNNAGYNSGNISIILDPLMVHILAIAKK